MFGRVLAQAQSQASVGVPDNELVVNCAIGVTRRAVRICRHESLKKLAYKGDGYSMGEKVLLEDDLMNYENKWVAISKSEDKVVGSGDNAYQAKLDAERNGYDETILFKVRPFGRSYSLFTA